MTPTALDVDAHRTLARREVEHFEGRHDTALAAELFAPGYVLHFGGMPDTDARGHAHTLAVFREAFPDRAVTVERQLADRDRVCNLVTVTGTHRGPFQGVPPTGKAVWITGNNVMRFAGGRIAELWGQLDLVGVMQQLGAMPTPPPGGPVDADPSTAPAAASTAASPAECLRLVSQFVERFNARDVAGLAALVGESYVLDFPGGPTGRGVAGIRQATTEFLAAFPDLRFATDNLFGEDGRVCWRWTLSATHRGQLGPVPASGKPVRVAGISVLTVAGGAIVHDRVRADMVGLFTQIGALL